MLKSSHSFLLSSLLVCTVCNAAHAQTAPAPFDLAHARAARIAQDAKTDLEWSTRTALNTYKFNSPHDPAWDALALKALTGDDGTNPEKSYLLLKAAVDAGCTDPMVRYLYIRRGLAAHKLTDAQAVPLYAAAAKDMDKSPYSPGRRLHLRVQFMRSLNNLNPISPADHLLLASTFEQSLNLLTSIDKENISPIALNDDTLFLYIEGDKIGLSHEHDFTQIDPVLKKLAPNRASTCSLEARYYIDWAWDARGGGYANTVSDAAWKLFNEPPQTRRKRRHHRLQSRPHQRRMPCFHDHCLYGPQLRPPHHGTMVQPRHARRPQQLPRMHRQIHLSRCPDGGLRGSPPRIRPSVPRQRHPQNRIPTFLLTAHEDIAASSTDSAAYLAQPKVWADIEAVYEKLLADKTRLQTDRMNYLFDRSKFIRHACDSQQWAEALNLMNQFGNDIDLDAFGGQAMYNFYKKKAAQELVKTPT